MYGNLYKMKISIVTAYHNRRKQFINTLNSILVQDYNCELEIIVVDDNSNEENRLYDINELFPTLDIKLLTITSEDKWWVNPCIPFNKGFSMVTGDVVIIQNPECLHTGNIIQATVDNIKENRYLVFGAYLINIEESNKINILEVNDDYLSNTIKAIQPMKNRIAFNGKDSAWYQHSKWRPQLLHFCTAITKKDLGELGGFDERFAYGVAKDDREFIIRIGRKGMEVVMCDSPFVLHQQHTPTIYSPGLTQINNILFQQIKRENIIKANK